MERAVERGLQGAAAPCTATETSSDRCRSCSNEQRKDSFLRKRLPSAARSISLKERRAARGKGRSENDPQADAGGSGSSVGDGGRDRGFGGFRIGRHFVQQLRTGQHLPDHL